MTCSVDFSTCISRSREVCRVCGTQRRWFLLDTLREVAPPRSAAQTSATSSTGSRPACAEKKNLTPTSTGGPLRLSAGVGLAVPPQSRLSGISEDFHPSRPSAARPRAVS